MTRAKRSFVELLLRREAAAEKRLSTFFKEAGLATKYKPDSDRLSRLRNAVSELATEITKVAAEGASLPWPPQPTPTAIRGFALFALGVVMCLCGRLREEDVRIEYHEAALDTLRHLYRPRGSTPLTTTVEVAVLREFHERLFPHPEFREFLEKLDFLVEVYAFSAEEGDRARLEGSTVLLPALLKRLLAAVAPGPSEAPGEETSAKDGSSNIRDAYRLLEVPEDATATQIRAAYLQMLKVWHPDRFQSDPALRDRTEAKAKELNAAFDLIRHAPLQRTEPAVPPPEPPPAVTQCPWCERSNRIEWSRRNEILRCGSCKQEFRLDTESGRSVRVEPPPPPEPPPVVVQCPWCETSNKIEWNRRNEILRCGSCKQEFHLDAQSGRPVRGVTQVPQDFGGQRVEWTSERSGGTAAPTGSGTTPPKQREGTSDDIGWIGPLFGGLGLLAVIGIVFIIIATSANLEQSPHPAAARQGEGGSAQGLAATYADCGRKASEWQDWAGAVKCFDYAAKLTPADSSVLVGLGVAYSKLGKYDLAVAPLQQAIRIDHSLQSVPGLLTQLVVLEVETARYAEALEHAEIAGRLFPEEYALHALKARALRGLGRRKDAAAEDALARKLGKGPTSSPSPSLASAEAGQPATGIPVTTPAAPRLDPSRTPPFPQVAWPEPPATPAPSWGDLDRVGIDLLNKGRYREAIHLYRLEGTRHPEARTRIQNLVAVFRDAGDLEVAYCLDPSDGALRAALEAAGAKRRGLCEESK
jgi:tetratricopeptide (TPR) repeat protein/DnaJ-domain-containing protein 1